MLVAAAIGSVATGTAIGYNSTDHHRTLKVFYDYQPKVTDRVTIQPGDYFAFYKTDPKNPDSTYELYVKNHGVLVTEREYPSTFRYLSLTHDQTLAGYITLCQRCHSTHHAWGGGVSIDRDWEPYPESPSPFPRRKLVR